MAFVGVEFDDHDNSSGNSIAVVSKGWLTPKKTKVYWPPFKNPAHFTRALKHHHEVEDDWEIHKINRCFFEYDDYGKAFKKIKLAENTSDLQSDSELTLTRKRCPPRRLSYDAQVFDSDENEEPPSKFQRPPSFSSVRPITTDKDSLFPSYSKDIHKDNSSASISRTKYLGRGSCVISREDSQSTIKDRYQDSPNSFSSFGVVEENTNTSTISTLVKNLLSVVHTVKEQNSAILNALQELKSNNFIPERNALYNNHLPENMPMNLPLTSENDVANLETYLKDKKNFSLLRSYLSSLGGKDITNKTNRILKVVLKDSLASGYSFYGKRQQKRPLANLLLKTLIVEAVKANSDKYSEKDIEDTIKV